MRRVLILLLALCACTNAMVLREKRAVNTEDEHPASMKVASSTKPANSSEICQPHTPCAWSIYKSMNIKIIDTFIKSTYCICGSGTECVIDEDDQTVSAYVHRCRVPGSAPDTDLGTR